MIAWRASSSYFLLACGAVTLAGCDAPGEPGAPVELIRARDDGANAKPPSGPAIRWMPTVDPKDGKVCAGVLGVDPEILSILESKQLTQGQWSSFFSVRVVSDSKAGAEEAPPLWGRYEIADRVIRFVPRFPPETGVVYRAEFDPARLRSLAKELSTAIVITEPKTPEPPITSTFSIEKTEVPPASVTAVYPSGERLPENLLRFYIHFSGPMSRGEAYRHLKLIDLATNKPVHAPFLELEEELWSPNGMRFTLLIDPGRIKRGLKPREMFGPVLEAGKSYCLVIDQGWTDAAGNSIQSEFRRTFRAGPPDESMPDPKKWSILAPQAGTRDPLEARFPEPLDRALLERVVGVLDPEGREVAGAISITEGETIWRFAPREPWRDASYRLVVGSELEDVAGNSVASPFEVDLTTPITKRVASDRVEVPFTPGSARGAR